MSKIAKWNTNKSQPKNEFHGLLCGKSKPILEKWNNDATETSLPPWAPKPTHTQTFTDTEKAYLAKIKALGEMSDHIYNKNLKLKYRLNAVAKEIKSLKRVKRVLCRRLFEHNSKELFGTYLEIPDSDTSTVVMDQIIGDVVNTATQAKIVPTPLPKKKRKEQKAPKNIPASVNSISREEEIHQHIISVIDNVANTSYNSSLLNGPTPSKKPRKQNLAALTSPTKNALAFSNGKNSNGSVGQISVGQLAAGPQNPKLLKQDVSPSLIVSQGGEFPANLPIYVKREIIYHPDMRDMKGNAVVSNPISNYSVQSTTANAIITQPSTSTIHQIHSPIQIATLANRIECSSIVTLPSTSNGQNMMDTNNYLPPRQTTPSVNSLTADSDMSPTNPAKYYTNKFENEDRSQIYTSSELTRENLKALTQGRMNTNSSQGPNDELRSQPPICAPTVPSLTNSSRDLF